ncbi:MAG: hypothetical protein LBS20_05185 [Prevotella sp.]|jgi:hypothetical protein|nr:hypothetical protein [Prevotella sp.]
MLEKFSLNDLIGIIFPGGVIVVALYVLNDVTLCYQFGELKSDGFFFQFLMLLLAYIIGMIVHAVADKLLRNNWKIKNGQGQMVKGDNNMLWRTSWISRQFKIENDDTQQKLIAYWEKKRGTKIQIDSDEFRKDIFRAMYNEVKTFNSGSIKNTQDQVTMFSNSAIAFSVVVLLTFVYILFNPSYEIVYKYSIPLIILAVGCYGLAVHRQWHLISIVYWNFAYLCKTNDKSK